MISISNTAVSIPASSIIANTITAKSINVGSISISKIFLDPQHYVNEFVSYMDFQQYGNTANHCVIYDVPKYSALYSMVGRTDENGNYYQTQ